MGTLCQQSLLSNQDGGWRHHCKLAIFAVWVGANTTRKVWISWTLLHWKELILRHIFLVFFRELLYLRARSHVLTLSSCAQAWVATQLNSAVFDFLSVLLLFVLVNWVSIMCVLIFCCKLCLKKGKILNHFGCFPDKKVSQFSVFVWQSISRSNTKRRSAKNYGDEMSSKKEGTFYLFMYLFGCIYLLFDLFIFISNWFVLIFWGFIFQASKLLQEAPKRDPILVGIIGCGRVGKQLANTLMKYCK